MDYDVFLSHSHKDKLWTHELYERLAHTDYNGRALRAWLDVRVLDPGDLSSPRELESALDRSRRLAVVLTPASVASYWVQREIGYFIEIQQPDDVVLIRRRPCDVPEALANCALIEWPESADDEEPREQLLRFLRPAAGEQAELDHRLAVRRAWRRDARVHRPKGSTPRPSAANSALLDLLLSCDITDLDKEGLALAGFDRVGQLIADMDTIRSFGARMVVGEFLAMAVLRHSAYARVAASYVRKDIHSETGPPSTTNLLSVVARSSSKLVEIDPSRVDLSTMAAVLHRLDQRSALGEQGQIVAMLVGRTLGKMRNTALVDALLYALVRWGGDASHVAAVAAISTAFRDHDPPVFYTEELKRLASDAKAPPIPPPLSRIARLLFAPSTGLSTNVRVAEAVRSGRADFARAFGAWKPDGPWPELGYAPPASQIENGPLVGTVRRVTLDNMECLADRLGPTEIACLTEPRIVDALLDGAGGYLIDDQQTEAPLGMRLGLRGARFATYPRHILERFEDGSVLALWPSPQGGPPRGFAVRAS